MPKYEHGFTGPEYDHLKATLRKAFADGVVFDAIDALQAAMSGASTINAGNVVMILDDLIDLGELELIDPDAPGGRRYKFRDGDEAASHIVVEDE